MFYVFVFYIVGKVKMGLEMKEEYLMLREEILHLDSVVNNTINFFYVFMATYVAFSLTQEDTIFILLSFIVTPVYNFLIF